MVPITGSGSSRAFPPRRGRRAASRLAPRAWYACSERLTTRREHRWTGPQLRAASKLQANAALTRGCLGVCGINGTVRGTNACLARAKTVLLICSSISVTDMTIYFTIVGHGGDTASISPF